MLDTDTHILLQEFNHLPATLIKHFDSPPNGEIAINPSKVYSRNLFSYSNILHAFNLSLFSSADLSDFYSGSYNKIIADSIGSIQSRFDFVYNLDPSVRENTERILYITHQLNHITQVRTIIDIGSGIGVFPYEMSLDSKYTVIAVDPDPASISFLDSRSLSKNICADLNSFLSTSILKDVESPVLVTLNQVLEHFPDPLNSLKNIKSSLPANDAYLYIEVPEFSLNYSLYGASCPAFFIDHNHIFSCFSLSLMLNYAGFNVLSMTRQKTKSGKVVIRSFSQPC